MTSYERSGERPSVGRFLGFDYAELYVSNAKQAADWYCVRFGFERIAYKGLETGSRDIASHVIRQNNFTLVLTSPLEPKETEISKRIMITGDAVKDVAFTVEDCRVLYEKAVSRGGVGVKEPQEFTDEDGTVVLATVQTYGDTVHTFVERKNYKGIFLPGFKAFTKVDPVLKALPVTGLLRIDHVVGNQPDLEMVTACDRYEKMLDFHRFWSVDDSQLHTEFSSLRSIVMTDWDEAIKMPINEPAPGKRKSQIQEYVDYHGGAGVQHVAMLTEDIIASVSAMRERGCDFLHIPKTYYEDIRKRLAKSPVQLAEDLDVLEKLGILIDFDDQGYLLQLFTKPTQDRPTLFYEVIQRRNHTGFGAGNFKALFESIERDQAERGNLN